MNQKLQRIMEIIQQSEKLDAEQKNNLVKAVKDADKEWEITAFKLERTEKVKKTTAILLEETIEELEQKRKAVEEQNRELEIEAALERVRSRSIGMHRTSELQEIVNVVARELHKMEMDITGVFLVINNNEIDKQFTFWGSSDVAETYVKKAAIPFLDRPIYTVLAEATTKGERFFIEEYSREDKIEFFKHLFKYPPYNSSTTEWKNQVLSREGGYTRSVSVFHYTSIFVVNHFGRKLSDADNDILKRFSRVFEQTYTRFLDLQKAEAQAREAQIEAALERIRSLALGMHKSEEVGKVTDTFFAEFKKLTVKIIGCSIVVVDEQKDSMEIWRARSEVAVRPFSKSSLTRSLKIIKKQTPESYSEFRKALGSKNGYLKEELSGKKRLRFLNTIAEQGGFSPQERSRSVEMMPAKTVLSFLFFKLGYLALISEKELPEENLSIARRFVDVFDFAYTRFLDLQKAEAQAREAQIEAALEKIRSRSLAMHKSDELQDLVNSVFDQLKELHIDMNSASIFIFEEGSKDWQQWVAAPETSYATYFHIPYSNQQIVTDLEKARQTGKDFFTVKYSFAEKNKWFDYAFKHTDYRKIPEKRKIYIRNGECMIISFALSKNTGIQITKYHGEKFSDEENEIVRRIAKVFEQAYVRFLDLKKAEAQAREAEIQLALEHVRAQSMAMHKSEDLAEVVGQIKEEIMGLGIEIYNAQITTDFTSDPNDGMNVWISAEGRQYLEKFHIPFIDHPLTTKFYDTLKNDLGSFTKRFSKSEKNAYFKLLFEHSDFKDIPEERKNFVLNSPGWVICWVILKNSMMEFARFNLEKFSREEIDVFKLFGKVFEQAYTRFLDLQKAEAQARESEIQLALERVRARTMAMHKSDELAETAAILFQQMTELGVTPERINICLIKEADNILEVWATDQQGVKISHHFNASLDEPTTGKPVYDAWKEKKKSIIIDLSGKELNDWIRYVREVMGMTIKAELVKEHRIHSVAFFSQGMILTTTPEPLPEESIKLLERFADVFNLTYRRFLDLQKAEAQARDAQIEAALERVRARSMAMHKSQDLHGVVTLVYEQLESIGLFMNSVLLHELAYDSKSQHFWVAANGQVYPEQTEIPITRNAFFTRFKEAQENKESFFLQSLSKRQKDNFFKHYFGHSSHSDVPEDRKDYIFSCDGLNRSTALHRYTALSIMRYDKIAYSEEQNEVIKRFAQVFEQSYQRYLDLKKAEEQARESEIQLALERVRARTMAMHNSNELGEVASVLFEQISSLTATPDRFNIGIANKEDKSLDLWVTDQEGHEITKKFIAESSNSPVIAEIFQCWEKQEKSKIQDLYGEKLENWVRYMGGKVGVPFRKDRVKDHRFISSVFFSHGFIGITTHKEPDSEIIHLLERFSKVFQQTYVRFLDLQKAEAQAREAQVEAALERVRSKSIGMRHTSELQEIVNIIARELHKMEMDITGVFLVINNNEIDKQFTFWGSSGVTETYVKKAAIPFLDRPIYTVLAEATTKGERFFTEEYSREEKIEFFKHLFKYPPYNSSTPEWKNQVLSREGGYTRSVSVFQYTSIFVVNHFGRKLSDADNDILKRFSRVFEQTYTRFLDLQKAEAQAKEATKQAALDRVRGEIASMRTTEDLNRITPVIWNELKALNVPFIRCGVFIINEGRAAVQVYLSKPDGQPLAALSLPFESTRLTRESVASWRKGDIYKEHWNRDDFVQWMQSLIDMGQVQDTRSYQGAAQPPESLDLHFLPFTQGMLYVGNTSPLTEDEIEPVQSLAEVFSVAYARYEDFKNLEEAKNKIEQTLSELKATQSQLVQAEKMASLGELTAGIAHEIQNPLNFVNNFSEVSTELLEEMKEEIENGDLEEVKAITQDVIQNLEKILHHGRRADGIVKGMLQHSRGSSGQKEPTDINTLCDEYLRLSYHGLRARDKSFTADFKLEADESLPKVNVVPQDMGRVLLNLINNAFYAVSEKAKQNLDDYKPTVTVSTIDVKSPSGDLGVEIRVKDNGFGIPDEVKKKIFQPFFTTKPTGQGTGLGLSMSYDIVKAHGGELTVESKDGEGTEFMIQLPVV